MKKTALALTGLLFMTGALANAQDTESMADRLKWSGDVRARQEWTQEQGEEARHRTRFRVRLGVDAKINDNFTGVARVTSGRQGDITSTYQNAGGTNSNQGGAFGNKDLTLDLAFISWRPLEDILTVNFGKQLNPIYAPGKNELLFDNDVTPEGYGLTYKNQMGGIDLFLNAGAFNMVERFIDPATAGPNHDAWLMTTQLGVGMDLAGMGFRIGAGRHHFAGLTNQQVLAGSPAGNTLGGTTGTNYTVGYEVLDGFAEVAMNLAELPVTLYGNYTENMAASDRNMGYIAGAKVGKLQSAGNWAVDYNYRSLEADATVAAFTEGDTPGTASFGHKVGVGYMLADATSVSVSYFNFDSTAGGGTQNYERGYIDLNVWF